jgi:hypothetical protein
MSTSLYLGSRLDFGYIDPGRAVPGHAPRTDRSHSFAGQLAGLHHPSGELSFVELVALLDVEVPHFLFLGHSQGPRSDEWVDVRSPPLGNNHLAISDRSKRQARLLQPIHRRRRESGLRMV